MHRRAYLAATGVAVGGALGGCLGDTSDGTGLPTGVALETVAEGLAAPWAMAFPSDSDAMLVTERDSGRLLRVDRTDGTTTAISGIPDVDSRTQGGLFDLALQPDTERLYFTYAASDEDGKTATHLGRGRLQPGSDQLTDVEVVHIARPFIDDTGHYGGRVEFGPDGLVYMTVGDRQFKNFGPDHVSQKLTNELGATLRLRPDGSVPEDNPFVDREDAEDSIYSYGHRNAEGMTVHPETNAIWQSEFGESSGDEINIVERGGNYGWPIADEGCKYGTDEPVGVSHDDREDVIAPVYSWPCGEGSGFPPCGMDFYQGSAFPDWEGDLFVGGLASQYLVQLSVDGREVSEKQRLLPDRGWRFRDVAVGPDDAVYLAIDADPAPIVRLVPA
jgi:quinoprotein glucose dehydrogenase